MIIQIFSNKHCKNGYYEEIIKDFYFGKYLQQEKAKINKQKNNDQVVSTLHN